MLPGPPSDPPPVLLTERYGERDDAEVGEGIAIRAGRLELTSGTGNLRGHALGDTTYTDVIVDAQIRLASGEPTTLYGLFLRGTDPERFVAFVVSPAGRCVVALVDGSMQPLVDGALDDDTVFHRRFDNPNRFQVVASGPCMTFLINSQVVTGVPIDDRFTQGAVGFLLVQRQGRAPATLAADWIQLRAVLPVEAPAS